LEAQRDFFLARPQLPRAVSERHTHTELEREGEREREREKERDIDEGCKEAWRERRTDIMLKRKNTLSSLPTLPKDHCPLVAKRLSPR